MLSDEMRGLREKAGLTQQDLASKAELSLSIVAQIEQGRKPDIRISTLSRLAVTLGVQPEELLKIFLRDGAGQLPRQRRRRRSEEQKGPPKKAGRSQKKEKNLFGESRQ